MGNKKQRRKRKQAQQRRVQQKKNISNRKNTSVSVKKSHNDVSSINKEIKDKIDKKYGTDYISLQQKSVETGMEIKHHKPKKIKASNKGSRKRAKLKIKWKNAFAVTLAVMAFLIIAFVIFMTVIVPNFKNTDTTAVEEPVIKKGITYFRVYDGAEIYEWENNVLQYNTQKVSFDIKDDREVFQCLVNDIIPDADQPYSYDVQLHKWYAIIELDGNKLAAYGDTDKPLYLKTLTHKLKTNIQGKSE